MKIPVWHLATLLERGGRTGAEQAQLFLPELENLVAACRRAVADDRRDHAVGAARASWTVFADRGPIGAGVALLEHALTLELAPSPRASLLVDLGSARRRLGRIDEKQHRAPQRFTGNGLQRPQPRRAAGAPLQVRRLVHESGFLRLHFSGRSSLAAERDDRAALRS